MYIFQFTKQFLNHIFIVEPLERISSSPITSSIIIPFPARFNTLKRLFGFHQSFFQKFQQNKLLVLYQDIAYIYKPLTFAITSFNYSLYYFYNFVNNKLNNLSSFFIVVLYPSAKVNGIVNHAFFNQIVKFFICIVWKD